MRRSFIRLLLLVVAGACFAPAQEKGLTPEWDIRAVLKEISAHAGRLAAMLDKLEPGGWSDKDGAGSYLPQWKSSRDQAAALAGDALELSRNPEKLPPALKAFFRMQALEFSLPSFAEGVRRYVSPETADKLQELAGENGANRNRFQGYIVELATQREEEYRIMDHEAQRCREILARESRPAPRKSGKK